MIGGAAIRKPAFLVAALTIALATVCAVATAASPAPRGWITVSTPNLHVDYGNLPARETPIPVGKVRLTHIARVTQITAGGRHLKGDLLVISGVYKNLDVSPSNWAIGTAYYIGTNPVPCALKTCGPGLPTGDWYILKTEFSAPVNLTPHPEIVPGHGSVSFKVVLPLSLNGRDAHVRDLRDLWLLPEYDTFFKDYPFERGQLVNLATYFGTRLPART